MVEQLWNWENLSQNFWEKWFDWFAQQFIKVFFHQFSYQTVFEKLSKHCQRILQTFFGKIISNYISEVWGTIFGHFITLLSNCLLYNFRTHVHAFFEQFIMQFSNSLSHHFRTVCLSSIASSEMKRKANEIKKLWETNAKRLQINLNLPSRILLLKDNSMMVMRIFFVAACKCKKAASDSLEEKDYFSTMSEKLG